MGYLPPEKQKTPVAPPEKNPEPVPENIAPKVPSAPATGPKEAGPFWPMVATSIFKDDPENPASFSNVERTIRKQPIEWGALFDPTGKAKVVLTANSQNSIPILPDLVKMMRRMNGHAIFTHNHPMNSSFSMDDVHLFIGCGMREIRVVSQRYVYSLSDPTYAFHNATVSKDWRHAPGWDLAGIQSQFSSELKSEEFKRLMIEHDVDGKARMMAMVMGTPMELEEHILVTDMVNRRLFTKWGLTYNVVPIEEQ